jgi:predicted cupin superfamily sugar epimerase
MEMTVQEIIRKLNLVPLPGEGGYYRRTWHSVDGTAIYYLLSPEENGFSAFHRLEGVEIYHFYAGDPVQLILLSREDTPERIRKVILGNRIERNEHPQYIVPAGRIQGSRLLPGGKWALLGTTMAPPYSPDIFKLCDRRKLLEDFPEEQDLIIRFTKEETLL